MADELVVQSGAAATAINIDNTATDGDPQIAFQFTGTTITLVGVDDTDDKFKIASDSSSAPSFADDTRMSISADGVNVLHESAGNTELKIKSTGTSSIPYLDIENDARRFTIAVRGTDTNKFIIKDVTANENRMAIDNSGNVKFSNDTGNLEFKINSTDTNSIPYLDIENDAQRYTIGIRGDDGDKFVIKDVTGTANRLELDTSGNFGLNRAPNTSYTLSISGDACKGTVGQWAGCSDASIKDNVQDIQNASDIIMKLRPVKFKYTEEYRAKDDSIKDHYYYSFIAQEFQEVFPDFVKLTEGNILALDPHCANIHLFTAMQEVIRKNEQQQIEIDTLKSEMSQLKEMISQLNLKSKSAGA